GQTITPPANPQQQPQIGPSSGTGDPTLIQGITTNPDGTIVVTLQNSGVAKTTVDGITVVSGTGGTESPAGGTPTGLAPSPEPIVTPDPNSIQGENELRLSPSSTSTGASD